MEETVYGGVILTAAIALLTFFFCYMGAFLVRFRRLDTYRRKEPEDDCLECIPSLMTWSKTSLVLLLGMFVLSWLTLVFGQMLKLVSQVLIILVHFYVACSFVRNASQASWWVRPHVADDECEDMGKTEESNSSVDNYEQLFGDKLDHWIHEKRYLTPQLTIDDLASEMGTNKLYMSRYINSKFGKNFSSLITQLRLAEAKTYMQQHPSARQEEVAIHSGFSSSSYFSKLFSKAEGMPPATWRKENAQDT